MEYRTEIDTVAIQIDCTNAVEQQGVLSGIVGFARGLKSSYVNYQDYPIGGVELGITKRKYTIYSTQVVIPTIDTGTTRMKHNGSYGINYYIAIKFAGLKKHDEVIDGASNDILLTVCAYLNTHGIVFKLTELDICLDVECVFNQMLAICTRKSSKTHYHALDDIQVYDTTTYIENIDKPKRNKSVLRSYFYDKTHKENLTRQITRFEIKLQTMYFTQHGFSIESIVKVLERYTVMYFESIEEKSKVIDAYNGYQYVRKRERERLGLDKYRLLFDIDHISNFIKHIYTVHLNNTSLAGMFSVYPSTDTRG